MNRLSLRLCALASVVLLGACAGKGPAPAAQPVAAAPAAKAAPAAPSTPGARLVKSRDGRFEGEMIGTPASGSRFSRLQIGMSMREVNRLIGAPDDMTRHETGKRWIPFYYGNDAQRMQVLYNAEGCLTYTGGNVFGGGGNELIRIHVDARGRCLD